MPRPKPKEQINKTTIRLTARHQAMLKELGGSVWIREMIEKYAKMPKKYYDVFLKFPTGETHAIRKQTTPLQERVRATETTWRTPQANGATEG